MILEWYKVDDKDISASEGEFIFRLKTEKVKIKREYYEDGLIKVQKLQVRKRQNTQFTDLGYQFLLSDDVYANKSDYVDKKVWEDVVEIASRAEEILLSLEFIGPEREPEKPKVIPTPVYKSVVDGIVKALKEKEMLGDFSGYTYKLTTLEDMFLRVLQFIVMDGPFDLEEDATERAIRLKEIEIEVKMLMAEPTMYYVGGWREGFRAQKPLRDEEWLNGELMEEELERQREEYKNTDWEKVRIEDISNYYPDFPKKLTKNLIENDIRTVQQLIQYSKKDLLKLNEIGRTSISKIEQFLEEVSNLELSESDRLE